MMEADTIIESITIAPTHDGQAALVVMLAFAGGGRSRVQVSGDDAAAVARLAGVEGLQALVGRSWDVLKIRQPSLVDGRTAVRVADGNFRVIFAVDLHSADERKAVERLNSLDARYTAQ